jgi:hypothetical protein
MLKVQLPGDLTTIRAMGRWRSMVGKDSRLVGGSPWLGGCTKVRLDQIRLVRLG